MYKDIHLKVEDSKAESFLSFLKELDFVEIEKSTSFQKSNKKKEVITSLTVSNSFPFSGMCPDWKIEAEDLRKGDTKKRLK